MVRMSAAVLVAIVATRPLTAQEEPASLDTAQLISRRDSFVILAYGRPIGSRISALARTPDSLVNVEEMNGGESARRSVIVLDGHTFEMRWVDISASVGTRAIRTHLQYDEGRVRGQVMEPDTSGSPKTRQVNEMVPEGTYDERAVALLVPALPLALGETFEFPVFSSEDGTTSHLLVFVGAQLKTIVVPAGIFKTFEASIFVGAEDSGLTFPMTLYVTQELPRRVIEMDINAPPMVIQLVK